MLCSVTTIRSEGSWCYAEGRCADAGKLYWPLLGAEEDGCLRMWTHQSKNSIPSFFVVVFTVMEWSVVGKVYAANFYKLCQVTASPVYMLFYRYGSIHFIHNSCPQNPCTLCSKLPFFSGYCTDGCFKVPVHGYGTSRGRRRWVYVCH